MKTSIFILCFFIISVNIFCDDWEFSVLQDSPIYTTSATNEPVGFLHIGKIIISNNNAGYGQWGDDIGEIPYEKRTFYNDIGYGCLAPERQENIYNGTSVYNTTTPTYVYNPFDHSEKYEGRK